MIKLEFKIPKLNIKLNVDTESILDEAAAALLQRTLTRFISEISPDGTPWVPSKAALRRKLKGGGGGGTLFDTGNLFHSLRIISDDLNTRSIGSDVAYGAKHQTGQGVVKREFIGFSQEDHAIVASIIHARVKDFIK